MANVIEIQDYQDPALDIYARLTEAQLRNRQDESRGMFIAESPKVITIAMNAGYRPVSFLMERRHIDGDARQLLEKYPEVPVYTGPREILEKLTGYTLTRGVLCAMHRTAMPSLEAVCANARRIAVLEGIVDSTNVGAIFRCAAALNVDAVVLTPTCCDPLCRRSVRVSMGTVFQVPWTRITGTWPEEGMEQLRRLGFQTAAMALDANSVGIDDPKLKAEGKLAILLGTEGDGLSRETIACSDYTVMIPMSHRVDSLNVAAASAVAFWELCR